MGSGQGRRAAPVVLVIALWLVGVAVVAAGVWMDRGARANGPEAAFAGYATAVERGDLNSALQYLVPEVRNASSSWVEWQLGNRYQILEMVVRDDSLLDRLTGRSDGSTARVVAMLEITGKGNPAWRAVEEMSLRLSDGKWLLEKPPLEGR